jgi:hypothetical protein
MYPRLDALLHNQRAEAGLAVHSLAGKASAFPCSGLLGFVIGAATIGIRHAHLFDASLATRSEEGTIATILAARCAVHFAYQSNHCWYVVISFALAALENREDVFDPRFAIPPHLLAD